MNRDLPVMMYIHGFRSGANGSKRGQLQEHFAGRYRVIAPEVDADSEKSLAKLNGIIAMEKPEIIVGTSLGGWMALMCGSVDARLVVVNPCTHPYQALSRWVGEELPYFCERLDGVQTYTLGQDVLEKYKNFDIDSVVKSKSSRIWALCSTADELLGDIHIKTLAHLLPADRLMVAGDFGHRCSGPGMIHLFGMLDNLAK